MAHVSGRTGTVAFDAAASTTVFGPGTTDIDLLSWELTTETDTFEAFSKADDFVTTFSTVTRWSGSAEYLHEDGVVAAVLAIREDGQEAKVVATITLTTGDSDAWKGACIITRSVSASPIDGPATYRFEFVGNGALTWTIV